jgi:1,4-alpha-glucan branching enzyme
MAMAVPDTWIRILKEKKDEEWDIFEIWHVLNNRLPGVGTVAYCESHDQALVGDQTLAFRLMQAEIYTHMSKRAKSLVIDRGIALHKMIRFLTITLGGQAYLNFMGNEFGHPDWIDFPREGNNWSYKYAQRQWSLLENPELRYQYLAAFDREMLALVKQYGLLNRDWGKQLNMDAENKTLVFERQGLIFVFNFHSDRSIPGYSFQVPKPGDYRHLLTTDHPRFGGLGRINEKQIHMTTYEPVTQTHWLSVYNTNRTAQVFTRLA